MKDIKTIMIGFLMATCMFLLMGNTSSNSEVGRYQLGSGDFTYTHNSQEYTVETIYKIDTKIGSVYAYGWHKDLDHFWTDITGLD